MKENEVQSKDLQKFIERFEPNKFKILPTGIEVRGMTNIHQSIQAAKSIIERFKLNLTVAHSADMAGYGGFEVKMI